MQLELNDIVTIIGLIVAFIGGQLTSRAQSQLEFKKWIRARQDDVRQDIRIAVADLAEKLAFFAHSMMWVTYNLNYKYGADIDNIESFRKESHDFISSLVGSQTRLAALDMSVYHKITPLVSDAINLSEEVFAGIDQFQQDREKGAHTLHTCNMKALAFIKNIPGQIGNTIGLDTFSIETE